MTEKNLKKRIKTNPIFFPDKPKDKEDEMAFITGTCKNCERPGLKIEKAPRGLCGICRVAASKGSESLAALKERIKTQGVRRGGSRPGLKEKSVKQNDQFTDQRKSRVSPSLHPGELIKTLLDEYHESANEAARIMDCLLILKKHGCDFEMPELHIVKTEQGRV